MSWRSSWRCGGDREQLTVRSSWKWIFSQWNLVKNGVIWSSIPHLNNRHGQVMQIHLHITQNCLTGLCTCTCISGHFKAFTVGLADWKLSDKRPGSTSPQFTLFWLLWWETLVINQTNITVLLIPLHSNLTSIILDCTFKHCFLKNCTQLLNWTKKKMYLSFYI